jgi:F-type H+-transporting ATPase subunit a
VAVDPIHQFRLERLIPIEVGGIDISFTNSALFMVLTVAVGSAFLILATRGKSLVPSRLQLSAEMLYEFVSGTVRESAGKEGMKFFPLVFSLFLFILVCNLWGMFPYFYTVTSQPIITLALTVLVIGLVVVYGFWRNGFGFLWLFVPSGIPVVILPFLVLIEVLSFLSRLLSLSMRLFANMLAGHITLKVFAGFVVSLGALGALGIGGAALALVTTVALTGLEFLVAGLQAYVFAMLTCLYLNDAIHPRH